MMMYSIPLVPNTIFMWVILFSNRYIILHFAGLTALGLFSVAIKFNVILNQLSQIFYKAWQMIVYDKYIEQDYWYIKNIYQKYESVMMIIVSTMITFIPFIFPLLVGEEYIVAKVFIPGLLLSAFFSSLALFFETIYQARFESSKLLISTLISGIANIILNITLIPFFSIHGAVIAIVFSFLLSYYIRFLYTKKILKLENNYISNISKALVVFLVILMQFDISNFLSIGIYIIILSLNWKIFKSIFKKGGIYENSNINK